MRTAYSSFIRRLRASQYNAEVCGCRPALSGVVPESLKFRGPLDAWHDSATCLCRGGTAARIRDRRLPHPEFANRRPDCDASAPADRTALLFILASEQPELARIALRLRQAEVLEGGGRQQAAAR